MRGSPYRSWSFHSGHWKASQPVSTPLPPRPSQASPQGPGQASRAPGPSLHSTGHFSCLLSRTSSHRSSMDISACSFSVLFVTFCLYSCPLIVDSPYSSQGDLVKTEIRPSQSPSQNRPVASPHLEGKIQSPSGVPMPLMTWPCLCLSFPVGSRLPTCCSRQTSLSLSLCTYSSGPAWGLCLVVPVPQGPRSPSLRSSCGSPLPNISSLERPFDLCLSIRSLRVIHVWA